MGRHASISSDNKVSPAQAIDRYFEVALYLMVLSGFATLAQTGQLDPPSVLLVIAALGRAGIPVGRPKGLYPEETWTQSLTIGFLVLSPVDFFLVSGKFVTATVHLVLALMVVRLFFRASRSRLCVLVDPVLSPGVGSISSDHRQYVPRGLRRLSADRGSNIHLLEMRRSSRGATLQARAVMGADTQRMGLHLAAQVPFLCSTFSWLPLQYSSCSAHLRRLSGCLCAGWSTLRRL